MIRRPLAIAAAAITMPSCNLPVTVSAGFSGGGEDGAPAWQIGAQARLFGGGKSPVGKSPILTRP